MCTQNLWMHSRNPYKTPPDFRSLAQSYPPLSQHIHGRTIDFHDDAAQRCLTQALLKRDFGLELELPADRLCPPIPNRLNYVLWIQDIVTELTRVVPFVFPKLGKDANCAVRGLDIGTGASAIYPLLTCSLQPQWNFVATGQLDDRSYAHAKSNIEANGLSDRISAVKVEALAEDNEQPRFGFEKLFQRPMSRFELDSTPSSQSTTRQILMETVIQFTMCNPPFYSDAAEISSSEAQKEQSAFGTCTGAPVEMITPGGEVHFVTKMIRESLSGHEHDNATRDVEDRTSKRRRVEGEMINRQPGEAITQAHESIIKVSECDTRRGPRWYTSMLGKMSSLVEVVKVFKELGIINYAITEFVQGQTRRWAVGWCAGGWKLSDDIARISHPNDTIQRLLPSRNTLRLDIPHSSDDGVQEKIALQNVLCSVESATVWPMQKEGKFEFVVSLPGDTWSRGARRKRKRDQRQDGGGSIEDGKSVHSSDDDLPALVCSCSIENRVGEAKTGIVLDVKWLYGMQRTLLESFASHVAKKISTAV